jgi:hypothetical protein
MFPQSSIFEAASIAQLIQVELLQTCGAGIAKIPILEFICV